MRWWRSYRRRSGVEIKGTSRNPELPAAIVVMSESRAVWRRFAAQAEALGNGLQDDIELIWDYPDGTQALVIFRVAASPEDAGFSCEIVRADYHGLPPKEATDQ